MTNAHNKQSGHSQYCVACSIAPQLLEAVTVIANDTMELAERRKMFLKVLADLIQADVAAWTWGCGTPDSDSSIVPVATIDCGLIPEQSAAFRQYVLELDSDRTFRQRIHERMQQRQQSQSTDTRRDIFPDDEWLTYSRMRRMIEDFGWSTWLHSVRYSPSRTWSNLHFLRNRGREEFGTNEAAVVDLAMTSVSWLHSTANELPPAETFAGLTARQRTVILMLLDGLTRKRIAEDLAITEDTVGDHIKSIYQHFKIGSATELAALFFRGR